MARDAAHTVDTAQPPPDGELNMPTLTLKIAPPCPPERCQARARARALTTITAETLGKRAVLTAVVIRLGLRRR